MTSMQMADVCESQLAPSLARTHMLFQLLPGEGVTLVTQQAGMRGYIWRRGGCKGVQGTKIKNQCLESFRQNDIVILCLSDLIKNQGLYFVLDILNSFFLVIHFQHFFLQKYVYDRLEIKILIFHHRWFEKHSVEDKICKCCLPPFAPKYNIRYKLWIKTIIQNPSTDTLRKQPEDTACLRS